VPRAASSIHEAERAVEPAARGRDGHLVGRSSVASRALPRRRSRSRRCSRPARSSGPASRSRRSRDCSAAARTTLRNCAWSSSYGRAGRGGSPSGRAYRLCRTADAPRVARVVERRPSSSAPGGRGRSARAAGRPRGRAGSRRPALLEVLRQRFSAG
jgi:hypothetical protein